MPIILIPREGYYQAGALLPKGAAESLHAGSFDEFKARIADAVPEADIDSLVSWDDVKTLDVKLNRLRRWHRPGLLCIGDAAHAMSPAGGVGINLAIADAVASARVLADPLLRHRVSIDDLRAIQKRRQLPAVVVQAVQRVIHRGVREALRGRLPAPRLPRSRWGAAALNRLTRVTSIIPAYIVGIGLRPERAPDFARRQPG